MLLYKVIFWLSILPVIYNYAGYPLVLLVLSRLRRTRPPEFTSRLPEVSLIIAAYNEEMVIGDRVENCLALDYPRENLEILIVSDGSDDGTEEIVEGFTDRGVKLIRIEDRSGKVNALHTAVPQAKGEILVFSDANSFFEGSAVRELVKYFGVEEVGGVCGKLRLQSASVPGTERPPGSGTGEMEGVYWRLETLLKTLEGRRGSALGANGAIFAIRKTLYTFCPRNTIVEDFVIAMKVLQSGHEVYYEPAAVAVEEAPPRLGDEFGRRTRIGAGDFQALSFLLPMLNPARGFPAFAFFSHKVLRWVTPFFLILALAANIPLALLMPYSLTLVAQGLFYAMAMAGGIAGLGGKSLGRWAGLPWYFVAMNLALFFGFFRFLFGLQKVTWKRTQR